MSLRERTSPGLGIIEPCLPSPAKAPPSGPGWLHEIKHDGFRILARRDPAGVRLITRAESVPPCSHIGAARRIDAEEKSAGGIIIPDTAKEKPSQGEVIAVGPFGVILAGDLCWRGYLYRPNSVAMVTLAQTEGDPSKRDTAKGAKDCSEYCEAAGTNGPNQKQSPKHIARGFLSACLEATAWLVAQLNTTE